MIAFVRVFMILSVFRIVCVIALVIAFLILRVFVSVLIRLTLNTNTSSYRFKH